MFRAVYVGTEMRAVFCQLSSVRQGKDLKTSTVGENRFFPAHESVQTAGLTKCSGSRAQIKMVSITKNYLCFHIVTQFALMHTLDGPDGSHGHKHGSEYLTVGGGYFTGSGI